MLFVCYRSCVTCSPQLERMSKLASGRQHITRLLTCAVKHLWLMPKFIHRVLSKNSNWSVSLQRTTIWTIRRYQQTRSSNQGVSQWIIHCLSCHTFEQILISSLVFRNAWKAWSVTVLVELIRYVCIALVVVWRGWREFALHLSWGTRRKASCWRGSCQYQTRNPVFWTEEVASIKNKVRGLWWRCIVYCY